MLLDRSNAQNHSTLGTPREASAYPLEMALIQLHINYISPPRWRSLHEVATFGLIADLRIPEDPSGKMIPGARTAISSLRCGDAVADATAMG
jgi:hypothetical protein